MDKHKKPVDKWPTAGTVIPNSGGTTMPQLGQAVGQTPEHLRHSDKQVEVQRLWTKEEIQDMIAKGIDLHTKIFHNEDTAAGHAGARRWNLSQSQSAPPQSTPPHTSPRSPQPTIEQLGIEGEIGREIEVGLMRKFGIGGYPVGGSWSDVCTRIYLPVKKWKEWTSFVSIRDFSSIEVAANTGFHGIPVLYHNDKETRYCTD